MGNDEIRETVHDVILNVARRVQPTLSELQAEQELVHHLGLRSMDLARILAMLELRLDADPFAELIAVTSVRTVGDVVNAYQMFFSGTPAWSRPVPEQEQAIERGRARREALDDGQRWRAKKRAE
jgi:acyl carrier protein